jgi:hypothetical protein
MVFHARSQLNAIIKGCGADSDAELRFEYEVSSGANSAHASQTDLMVLGKVQALAVEAKWTEPAYPAVAKRLQRRTRLRKNDLSAEALAHDREHQEAEVRAWLDRLQKFTGETLTSTGMADVVYQMIHRAASALATGLSPSLLYLHFHDIETQHRPPAVTYKADLAHLYKKLGRPPSFRFYVATQPITRTDVFRTIERLSPKDPSTIAAVKRALQVGPLFKYEAAAIEKVD